MLLKSETSQFVAVRIGALHDVRSYLWTTKKYLEWLTRSLEGKRELHPVLVPNEGQEG